MFPNPIQSTVLVRYIARDSATKTSKLITEERGVATKNITIHKVSDEEIIKAFDKIADAIGSDSGEYVIDLSFADGHNNHLHGAISDLRVDGKFKSLVESGLVLTHKVLCRFPSIKGFNIEIVRQPGTDTAKLNFPENADSEVLIKFLSACQIHLRSFERSPKIDELLGEELSEFYRRREEALAKLEGLSQQIIEKNEKFREDLESKNSDRQQRAEEEKQKYFDKLDAEYQKKHLDLETREEGLAEKAKELDDRASRHVRREIRRELKKSLAERAEEFTLTKSTSGKRKVIHAIFLVLIVFSASIVGVSYWQLTASAGELPTWLYIKLAAGTASFIGAAVFYIRWNDRWFRQHADEEFLLKRLELDIDRASWVVEMALEWKEEEGKELPDKLLDRLTENLFVRPTDAASATHPAEDLSAALMSTAAGITINIPGVGEVALDRKSLRRFMKESEKQHSS